MILQIQKKTTQPIHIHIQLTNHLNVKIINCPRRRLQLPYLIYLGHRDVLVENNSICLNGINYSILQVDGTYRIRSN